MRHARFQAASACGNIIGPYLFVDSDAPLYRRGFKACMAIFATAFALILLVPPDPLPVSTLTRECSIMIVYLHVLNRAKAAERVRNGKPAYIHDLSMERKYRVQPEQPKDDAQIEASTTGAALGDQAFLDLTDMENDEVSVVIPVWCLPLLTPCSLQFVYVY